MNFSPFGGHFPASIPVHQFTTPKFNHENNSTINGINSQNGSVMNEEPMVSSANRYPAHYNQHEVPIKYQRDSSTQIGGSMISVSSALPQTSENIHHYSVYPHETQGLKRAPYQENIQPQEVKIENSQSIKEENCQTEYTTLGQQQPGMPPTWQSIAAPGSTVADYLSHLPASTLPISLHHFLKYSTDTVNNKKDVETSMDPPPDHHSQNQPQDQQLNHLPHHSDHQPTPLSPNKRRKKKKVVKEKKPRQRPGDIRLTTALDGSTLFCCPECHMAYPDKSLLEQHLLGHSLERRFFCDICGAGLKRKDHLTRHKQSHNPDRPHVCSVCMKAFKRKEQLTLHFVIHSGEKRHVCPECGKGFYRKDHLRKHTRSHIARRVKAEQGQNLPNQQAGEHS